MAVSRLLDVCCELLRDNVTEIKMEVGLPIRVFRDTDQTASMICPRQQRCMKR